MEDKEFHLVDVWGLFGAVEDFGDGKLEFVVGSFLNQRPKNDGAVVVSNGPSPPIIGSIRIALGQAADEDVGRENLGPILRCFRNVPNRWLCKGF